MHKIQTTTMFSHQILEESNKAINTESQMLRSTRRSLAAHRLQDMGIEDREILYFNMRNAYDEEKTNAIHEFYYDLQNYDDLKMGGGGIEGWGRRRYVYKDQLSTRKFNEVHTDKHLENTKGQNNDWNWTRMDEAQALHDHCFEGVDAAVGETNFEMLQKVAEGLNRVAKETGENLGHTGYDGSQANVAQQYVNDIIHEMTATAKGVDKWGNPVENQATWLQARQEDFLKDLLVEDNGKGGEFTWEEWQDFAETFNIRNELMQGQWLMVVIGVALGVVFLAVTIPLLCGLRKP